VSVKTGELQGLNEHKTISAPKIDILEKKANLQVQKWRKRWALVELRRNISEKKEASLEEAERRTKEAQADLEKVENLLVYTTSIDDTIDWESLKKKDKFKESKPSRPEKETYKEIPPSPDKLSSQFTPTFSSFENIFKSKREKKIKEYGKKYIKAVQEWENLKKDVEIQNKKIDSNYEVVLKQWDDEVKKWEERKNLFYQNQTTYNDKIEKLKESYFNKDVVAIVEYCEMVLNNSDYPDSFPKNFELEYNPANQILIVEYQLPNQENLPSIKEVKYVPSKKELKKYFLSEVQLNKMYDNAIYQIALRTIHELFEADAANVIAAISFNGWVDATNKATGIKENICILSIQTKKESFMQIQLANIDPKVCFKNLKGVASIKLSSLTPIQPILQISKKDKRFIEGYDVANFLEEATNIAAMDWEDFEHLIREIFEKEFSINGGEVKVTRASRDGGVDAIAFDPDPIRGGKIVIQAKRYTNAVGLSAVRDLYGTVVNEGATKGILVTTADYGPDAYEFAKGKPLTLLSGSNLLHILEKHGYHAKIDLKEAKKALSEKNSL
jgi:restriction system protein